MINIFKTLPVPRIIVIGSATIDNFIDINPKYIETECRIADKECELVLPYGAKVPVDQVEMHCGGNAANVAVGLKRLEISVVPVIPLGKDLYSNILIGQLIKEGLEVNPRLINEDNLSNVSFVLRYNGERTILSHHNYKSYIIPTELDHDFVYFSSHDDDNTILSTKVLSLMSYHDSKLIFAPAKCHIIGDSEILEALIARSFLTICNKEEAYDILNHIDHSDLNITNMLHSLSHYGAHHVVITDGPNGVYYLDGDTGEVGSEPSIIDKKTIIDTTGAGDAMCTGVIYALTKNKPIHSGVLFGLQNSSSVIKYVGAQAGLLHKSELTK